MRGSCPKVVVTALIALLGGALGAQAYERRLTSRSLRQAYFLGKDTTFRSKKFLQDYVQLLPVPKQGVHVQRIELVTPFKEMVDRARRAPDGYNPVKAEADYRRLPPPFAVKVTLRLSPTYPAHTPYAIPTFRPISFRDPDFWQAFDIHLVQRGDIAPAAQRGRPLYTCNASGSCWLVGAEVTLEFDPDRVASQPAHIYVLTPDGQQVEAEFDLDRLR